MILAGDVGGTKTLLGLFENTEGRPRAIAVSAFPRSTGEDPHFHASLGSGMSFPACALV
jgi:hypothetical protein